MLSQQEQMYSNNNNNQNNNPLAGLFGAPQIQSSTGKSFPIPVANAFNQPPPFYNQNQMQQQPIDLNAIQPNFGPAPPNNFNPGFPNNFDPVGSRLDISGLINNES